MGAVDLLMARYAGQKPANPDLYYKLMVSACTGVDLDILNSIWHPTHGIKGEFLPSVPTVVDFLHERLQRRQEAYESTQARLKQLTKPEEPKESEEERAAAVAKWEAVRKNMKLKHMNEGEGRQGVNTAETSPAAPKHLEEPRGD